MGKLRLLSVSTGSQCLEVLDDNRGHTLIRQLPVPLLPLSFTPNLITVILSTINSLSLNYPVSSRSRTLLLVLS